MATTTPPSIAIPIEVSVTTSATRPGPEKSPTSSPASGRVALFSRTMTPVVLP